MTKKRLYGKVKTLKLVLLLFFACLLFLNTKEIGLATQKGLRLCTLVIIPSLFPFFIISQMITPLLSHINNETPGIFTKLFHISPSGKSALLLGMISGFPVGARTVASLYKAGDLSKDEAYRLLSFCNNTGPAFVIGTIGTLFQSLPFGIFLYLLQICVASLTGIALGVGKKGMPRQVQRLSRQRKDASQSFPEIVLESSVAILKVCAFVITFQILIGIIVPVMKSSIATALVAAILEIGNAVSSAGELLSVAPALAAGLAAFSVSFSGVSVFMQSEAFLKEADLSVFPTIPVKLLQGLIAAIIAFLASPFFF